MTNLLTQSKSIQYLQNHGWTAAEGFALLEKLETVKMGARQKYRQSDLDTAIAKRLERPKVQGMRPVTDAQRLRAI
jgi:hypothetical protein